MKVHSHPSSLFHHSSAGMKGRQISLFLCNFEIDDVLETTLVEVGNGISDMLPGERHFALEYADNTVSLCDDNQAVYIILDKLAINVHSLHLPNEKYLYKTEKRLPMYSLWGMEVVEKFVYLGSCVTDAGGVKI